MGENSTQVEVEEGAGCLREASAGFDASLYANLAPAFAICQVVTALPARSH